MPSNPKAFLNAVRAHNKALKASSTEFSMRSIQQQEKKFRENPYKFGKHVIRGKECTNPSFDKASAFNHFQQSFSDQSCEYTVLPDWVESAMPPPNIDVVFDLSPITPGTIKQALKKCSSKSAPGCNGISYYHLKHLPSCHHFLATLFSRILLKDHTCPSSWCVGKIILAYKSGPASDPSSFRPIALTSTIGKLFNRILASRFEKFIRGNGIVDPSIQKGFLSGIPGALEHIFTTSAILSNSKSQGQPLYMSFLDISNAFGSISQQLINDILEYIQTPSSITSYINHAYSQLKGFVYTSNWSTDQFSIERGIFQGDTLSPLIFLVAFNPILCLANSNPSLGYTPCHPVPASEGLPPVDSHIYLEWNEPSSDEPPGWYRCSIVGFNPSGSATVRYPNGSTEIIDLRIAQWHLATGNSKHFLKPSITPPTAKVPKVREKINQPKLFYTTPHRVKGYCDDLTLISSSCSEHAETLAVLDRRCHDLDLRLKPQKCISLAFNGKQVDRNVTFPLSAGNTRNIVNQPTKFLGKWISHCTRSSGLAASSCIKSMIVDQLSSLDTCKIRGEYKTWILQHLVIPALHFHLMVNDLPKSHISSIQRIITRYLKKWLNLPPCTTLAVLFHPDSVSLKFLPQFVEEAKLSLLNTVLHSCDQLVLDCLPALKSPSYLHDTHLDCNLVDTFHEAITQCQTTLQKKSNILSTCRKSIARKYSANWESHLQQLEVQSKLLDVLPLGSEDHLWQRLLLGMPEGHLSFILRASCDCLPSPSSLARWGYLPSRKCPLCSYPHCNAQHILSCCSVSLSEGRYTYRHDLVLAELIPFLQEFIPSAKIFADLPNHRAVEQPPSTVPPSVISTSARPDIFIIQGNLVTILELTVPWNSSSSIENARVRKQAKASYQFLASDLHAKGFKVNLLTIEIGCLGHYTNDAYSTLKTAAPSSSSKDRRAALQQAAKAAIAGSHTIFKARSVNQWCI